MKTLIKHVLLLPLLLSGQSAIDNATAAHLEKIIDMRHQIHQNPELGNREFKTAELVADYLRSLGFDEVKTAIAYTGVIGIPGELLLSGRTWTACRSRKTRTCLSNPLPAQPILTKTSV